MQKHLLEKLRQNIAGCCQQTFENKKFVDITQQCFALLPLVTFPANNLKVMGSTLGYLLKSILLYYFKILNFLISMFFFIGIPCGLAHQECPLSWTVLFLPHQVVLHLQYSYHSPICSRFQSLCYLTDVVCEICRKFYRQFVGCLVRCWRWPSLPYWRYWTCNF